MTPNYPGYPAGYQQAPAKKSGALKWVLITLICLLLVSGGISAMVISAIRAHRARELNAPPPFQPPPPPQPPSAAGLEEYKYPNATVKETVNAFGQQVVTMTTGDSVSEVGDYYKKRFGDPIVEDENGDSVVFHISGSLTTIITVGKDKEDSDKTEITVVRSNIKLPKVN